MMKVVIAEPVEGGNTEVRESRNEDARSVSFPWFKRYSYPRPSRAIRTMFSESSIPESKFRVIVGYGLLVPTAEAMELIRFTIPLPV